MNLTSRQHGDDLRRRRALFSGIRSVDPNLAILSPEINGEPQADEKD
jgi:hypothetical protein